MTEGTPDPCGCVLVFDKWPVSVNGVRVSSVRHLSHIERCPAHDAEWHETFKRFAEGMAHELLTAGPKTPWPVTESS